MRKQYSKSRTVYEKSYSYLRRVGELPWAIDGGYPKTEAQECALISLDYHDSHFDGWINRHRQAKFNRLNWAKKPLWDIPF